MEILVTALLDGDQTLYISLSVSISIYFHLSKQFNQTANHGGADFYAVHNIK